jgi:hypothetical protein
MCAGSDHTGELHIFIQNKSMDFRLWGVEGSGMFFSAYCDEAGAEVLLGPDNVLDLGYGQCGMELHYRCYCGQTGVIYPKPAGQNASRRCA